MPMPMPLPTTFTYQPHTLTTTKQQVIAHSTPGAIKSWTNHVDGTIVLLNLRGVDLLKSEAGYDIFTQARSQIVSPVLSASFDIQSHQPSAYLIKQSS
jgi:hypothetical protein